MASWHIVKDNLATKGRFNGNLPKMGFQIHIYALQKEHITLRIEGKKAVRRKKGVTFLTTRMSQIDILLCKFSNNLKHV